MTFRDPFGGAAGSGLRARRNRAGPWLAGAAALLMAGCGGREGGVGTVYPDGLVGGTAGRRCEAVSDPESVPAFDDLVRVGTRGSLAMWGRGAEAGDSVEVSIRYDEEGRLTWVQTLRSTLAPARITELERILRSAVEEEGPEDWGVRVRLVAGGVEAVLSSVICDPVRTADGTGVSTPLGTNREMAELYSSLGRPFSVEVALDERGRVVDAWLSHTSGSRLLDQYALDRARASRYEPKLHDGIGVPSVLPIKVRFRRRL